MYSRRYPDIIQQQIEGTALILARLMGIKVEGNFAIVQTAVGDEFQKASGLNVKLALALSEESLGLYFTTSSDIDLARTLSSAILLEEYARLAQCQNLAGSANAAFRRSLALYRAALEAEETLRTPEFQARIAGILAELGE